VAAPIESARQQMAPGTQLIMNEFIPFIGGWCAGDGRSSCDWASDSSRGQRINRQTLDWSLAAASFAYGFGRLSEMGFAWVGADQLVGGTWPDNEPAVAALDWTTGEPNAKYHSVRMLATAIGTGRRSLHRGTANSSTPTPTPGQKGDGTCGFTTWDDDCDHDDSGAINITKAGINSLDDCVAHCSKCAKANYVSFSVPNEDCSWYAHCEMTELIRVGAKYVSEAVHPSRDPDAGRAPLYVLGHSSASLGRVVLLVSKKAAALSVTLDGAGGKLAQVLEGVGDEPGFAPPTTRRASKDGELQLGPFAVALVWL